MGKGYDHGEAMDLLAETLRRNRERTDAALAARQERVKEEIRATWRAKALRAIFKYVRPVTNATWRFWVKLAQVCCWIVIPAIALALAEAVTAGIQPGGHSELATATAYVVAAISGILAARAASNRLGIYARPIW